VGGLSASPQAHWLKSAEVFNAVIDRRYSAIFSQP
jgi:hypothetical protein